MDKSKLIGKRKLPANVDEELSRLAKMDLYSDEDAFVSREDMKHGARRLLDDLNYFIDNKREDTLQSYIAGDSDLLDYYVNARDHIDKIQNRRGHRMVGDSQQNIDFLVDYLRNKGIAI